MRSFAEILDDEMAARRTPPPRPRPRVRLSDAVHAARVMPQSTVADLAEAKRRFRRRALETHPDRGGSPAAFMAAVRDYEKDLRDLR